MVFAWKEKSELKRNQNNKGLFQLKQMIQKHAFDAAKVLNQQHLTDDSQTRQPKKQFFVLNKDGELLFLTAK